jgi:hypothetical protein
MPARRFPPPWSAEDHLACFIVKDSTGQALAHIYYELCFLIKGKCGSAGECLVSLEHFVDDVWKPLEYDSGEPGDRHDKTKRRKIKGPTF